MVAQAAATNREDSQSSDAKFGLSARIVSDLRGTFRRYAEIETVLVFGSRSNGVYRFNSDIDLAVNAPTMDDARFAVLWVELDDLPIVFKLDVLHLQKVANPHLRARIVEEGVRFWPADDVAQVGRASVLAG